MIHMWVTEFSHPWFGQWLAACTVRKPLVRLGGIHLIPKLLFCITSSKIFISKLLPHLPGANKLISVFLSLWWAVYIIGAGLGSWVWQTQLLRRSGSVREARLAWWLIDELGGHWPLQQNYIFTGKSNLPLLLTLSGLVQKEWNSSEFTM